jgi:hypothetical protein
MNIYRGDTALIEVTITNSAGVAFDLSGYTIKFTAKGPKVISKDTSDGITITDAAGGLCTINLSTTDTATCGIYAYDVEISTESVKYTVVKSQFSIIDDITK